MKRRLRGASILGCHDQSPYPASLPGQVDVLIVGAGISGIDAAYRVQSQCPDRSYAVLEARASLGGTWDLFRYPGVRAHSDIYTLSFPFQPWTGENSMADGEEILDYLRRTVDRFGIAVSVEGEPVEPARHTAMARSSDLVGADPDGVAMKTFTGPLGGAEEAWRPEWRRAEIGAASGHGNARSLATIHSVIACGGTVDGVRLLSPRAIDSIFRQ
ncbi:NAD(P)-binding protein [Streptomyces chartreusis]|uniref:NAD(P)-binding protein n=1 Tax=Streptomyces chartreusis TaxID=1969 RepID=UPI0033B2C455